MITTWPIIGLGTAIGLAAGSFAATIAVRIASEAGVPLTGRSRCDHCGVRLSLVDTLPLISYLARRGRCGACGGVISWLHPVGEAAGAIVVASALLVSPWPPAILLAVLGSILLTAALIDAATLRLPDSLTAAAAALGAALAFWDDRLIEGVASASLAGLVLLVLRAVLKRQGRPALGLGDVKLVAALALWLGLTTPWCLAAAGMMGLVALPFVRPVDGRLAFGPFLAIGAWCVGLVLEAGAWPM